MPVLLVLLAACTHDPKVGAVQPTEPPPTPLTAPSSHPTRAVPSTAPTGSATAGSPTASAPKPSSAAPSPAARPAHPDYVFPVRSSAISFGRTHHDYPATDIFAPCGSDVVAVTDGVVSEVTRKDTWTARGNTGATRGGLSVAIVGTDGVRYYGSHLTSVVASIRPGRSVRAGAVLGHVGRTGSARPTSCHLHFGISPPCASADWWNRRGVVSPYPFLSSWRHGGRRSPVTVVAGWRADHGCPKQAPAGGSD
jgi:murein DD-endopeptidase MepM/ murein hydrolase activator NlpD